MAQYRRTEIVSGLFVTAAIAVFALFAFKVGSFDFFGFFKGESVLVRAYLTDVKSLKVGAEVKVGGRSVGKVTSIQIVERPLTQEQARRLQRVGGGTSPPRLRNGMLRQLVEVEFELWEETLKLNRETASVTLNQESVLSAHFLELDPGFWSEGQESRPIFEAGFDGVVVIASHEGTGLNELIAIIKPVLEETSLALRKINEELLSSQNLNRFETVLEDLEQTLASTREASRGLAAILDRNEDPRLHEILDNLSAVAGGLEERLAAVQTDLQSLLADASGVLTDNRAGLAELVRRLNRAAWQAELALRKIRSNPSVLFFGDDETDFEALERDESGTRYSGRVRPYSQREEN